jgi:peptidoglycan/LPS O-acetylase OafA/YrhL
MAATGGGRSLVQPSVRYRPAAVDASGEFVLGQRPWLDGMRAVAVMAVVFYHELYMVPFAHLGFAIGGLLGVDVFFVISGFLITCLLLEERRRTSAINLGAFYIRRARRLLPPVGALLAVIVIGAVIWATPNGRADLFRHALATATYSTNWVEAFGTGAAHYELGHTWSLAVEEQFYLLWPLLLVGLLRLGFRGKRLGVTLLVAAIAMVLYRTELVYQLHWTDRRVYTGFDTRCDGLLMGCTLAVAFHYGLLPIGAAWTWIRRAVGSIGAVVLALMLFHSPLFIARHAVTTRIDMSAAAGLATAAIIWALISEPDALACRALAIWPMRSLGRISYGIYL